jgi:hypothetical protein
MRNRVVRYIGIWKWVVISVVGNLDYCDCSIYVNCPCVCAYSTFSRSRRITLSGSFAVKVALPATMTLLPASAAP